MTASERREILLQILVARRFETVPNLAAELSVSKRTIYYDITKLTTQYPIDTVPGHKGGVKIASWYHASTNLLSLKQQKVILSIIPKLDENEQEVMREVLIAYGSSEIIKELQKKG